MKREHDEKGAILVVTVVLMAVTLVLASTVIDFGGDRVVRQDMQSVADVVALDLARNLDGSTLAGAYPGFDATGPSPDLFAAAKANSVTKQTGLFAQPDSVTSRLAVADQQTGVFVRWATASEVPNAIRVYASGSSAFRMLPSTPRSQHMQRSALAVIGRPLVCISAGATLADLTPGGNLDVLLGGLIGLSQLSAVGPGGVTSLNAVVPLGQLATQLNAGTVDQIGGANVTTKSFLVAAATVLSNNGDNAAANVLNAIAARVTGGALTVSQILKLTTGAGSATNLNLDAFSLAQAVILASDHTTFVNLIVPVQTGLTSTTISAKAISPPQIACGPAAPTTKATSSQIQLKLTTTVGSGSLVGNVTKAEVKDLLLTAGWGAGTVTDITCSAAGSILGVSADTSVGKLSLHLLIELLLGVVKLTVDAPASGDASIGSSTSTPLSFSFPAGSTTLPAGQVAGGAGTTSLGLASLTPLNVTSTGLLSLLGLGTTISSLTSSVVRPLLGTIDSLVSPLLNGILSSLGLRLGTVEIAPVTRPACNEPVLRD